MPNQSPFALRCSRRVPAAGAGSAALLVVAVVLPLIGCASSEPRATPRTSAIMPGLGPEAYPTERFTLDPAGARPLASVERRLPAGDDLASTTDRGDDATSNADGGAFEPEAR